jgi:BolA family transcriptional regulator, general stress-responsive regulator
MPISNADATGVGQTIRSKLEAAFAPAQLEIENESHLHSGHAGSPGTGHSHFRVRIVSEAFRGQSRLTCHRQVNEVLSDELKGVIHALAVTTGVPG